MPLKDARLFEKTDFRNIGLSVTLIGSHSANKQKIKYSWSVEIQKKKKETLKMTFVMDELFLTLCLCK